jgi:hypothetical protein
MKRAADEAVKDVCVTLTFSRKEWLRFSEMLRVVSPILPPEMLMEKIVLANLLGEGWNDPTIRICSVRDACNRAMTLEHVPRLWRIMGEAKRAWSSPKKVPLAVVPLNDGVGSSALTGNGGAA